MRTFWIVLVALALAAGAWVYVSRSAATQQAQRAAMLQAQSAADRAAEKAAREAQERAAKAADTPKPETPKPETPKPEAPKADPAKPEGPARAPGVAGDPASAKGGVVTVSLTAADGKPLSKRSGVLLAADLIATPAHLLDQAVLGTVSLADGSSIPVGGSLIIDAARDVAILKLVTPVPAATPLRPAAAETPAGAAAFLIAPDAAPLPVNLVGYRTDTVQGRRVQVRPTGGPGGDLPANPVGMPIVNADGELVGLTTGKDAAGAALVLAAAEIAGLPRGKVTPLTTTVLPIKKDPGAPAATPTAPAGTSAAEQKAEVASEAKIEKKDDGTLLVDGKYVVKGEGTKEKPYEVTWEMLTSAQDDYDPRKGKKQVPGRIAMLDGKWVRISGYIAFPLYVDQPKELLSMLNQWDGCCIGVPPTPYDAIEVRLTGVVPKDDRLATSGVVTGKLGIKPYLVGDWLVGLYIMDDATMTTKQYGGFGS
jgi:outer membrane biosynthesis protein TonB